VFIYEDDIIKVDENYRLNHWPDGFYSVAQDFLTELLSQGCAAQKIGA
jgi:hypothetical protein